MTTILDRESQPAGPLGAPGAPTAGPADQPKVAEPAPSAADRPDLSGGDYWFSDAKGGFWVATTTAICLIMGGGGHLVLMSAYLGQAGDGSINWVWTVVCCQLLPSVALGLLLFVFALVSTGAGTGGGRLRPAIAWGSGGLLAGLLFMGALCLVAFMSSDHRQVQWQPVVGSSMAIVALASFGGYFLASRRARVGIAASFVLTFLLLFTYLLTLEALNTAATGTDAAAMTALGSFLTDFRGDVGLIIAFYFGTDAAVSAAKILKSKQADPAEISRMDRDIAVPRAK